MRTQSSLAIRAARRETRLTQEQLAQRLGVKASAVARWESGRTPLPPRRRQPLVSAITGFDVAAGAALQAALSPESGAIASRALERVPPSAVALEPRQRSAAEGAYSATGALPSENCSLLELLVFRMSDQLELAPGRLRSALTQLLQSLRESGLGLEQAERELAAWQGHGSRW